MKKLHIIPAFLLMAAATFAQTTAKKYVLLEHFTNSKCSICASRNPTFYNLIGQTQYADDVHHISIHPSVPYPDCVFYLANTTENNAWANVYNIQGTPRVAIGGNLMPASSQLLRVDTLNKYVGKTSPLYLKVTETGTGMNRTATIEAQALSQIPAGNYKLYVALAEKTINQVTPNNEAVHHDVFRKMLTPMAGETFTPPAAGQSATFSFNYTITSPWNAGEIYALAFVKDATTGQVLNSGTKFDAVFSATQETPTQGVRFSPNPVSQVSFATIGDDTAVRTEVFDVQGKRVFLDESAQSEVVAVSTANFSKGIFFVKITGEKAIYTAKMVKE